MAERFVGRSGTTADRSRLTRPTRNRRHLRVETIDRKILKNTGNPRVYRARENSLLRATQ